MERIKWVDVAKGWGIILVIYGHIANDYISFWLYTFHVPLFFFLSGYFFNPEKAPIPFLKSKAKGLLLPYLTLGIPLFIVNVYYGIEPLSLLKNYAIQYRASTLWFIAALFIQFVLAYIIYHCISSPKIRWIFITLLTLIGITLWHQGILKLPWNIDVSLVTLPFFCLGHDLRYNSRFKRIFSYKTFGKYFTIFLLLNILGAIIMYYLPYPTIDLCESHFSFEPLAYFTALSGIFVICLISNKWYFRLLSYIGQNSIVYFVWQQDIGIMIVNKILNSLHLLDNPIGIMVFVKNIIILLLSIILLTLLNEIIVKTNIKVLIGKR